MTTLLATPPQPFGHAMDEQLALFDPGPTVTPPSDLSTTARRTRRNRILIEVGIHPATHAQVLATGPTCGTCTHATPVDHHDRTYWKCDLHRRGITHGGGTDIRKSWPACQLHEAITPFICNACRQPTDHPHADPRADGDLCPTHCPVCNPDLRTPAEIAAQVPTIEDLRYQASQLPKAPAIHEIRITGHDGPLTPEQTARAQAARWIQP